ncbi:hypothetical protein [Staphylococcus hominis]|uniref:hypothetical protein n=1 Tax=Staphylococcus hominis TaxID=1290 RepID=UPI0011A64648|nr:hypothetical protein [Staphylococcus hominis]MCI2907749.1 hypothetical protein [Staphylococcus hominis]
MAEVKLSQESYDELLSDITALRLQADTYFEQWKDAKRKAEAFDEIERLVSKTKSAEDFGECVLQLLIENKEANHEG